MTFILIVDTVDDSLIDRPDDQIRPAILLADQIDGLIDAEAALRLEHQRYIVAILFKILNLFRLVLPRELILVIHGQSRIVNKVFFVLGHNLDVSFFKV